MEGPGRGGREMENEGRRDILEEGGNRQTGDGLTRRRRYKSMETGGSKRKDTGLE